MGFLNKLSHLELRDNSCLKTQHSSGEGQGLFD